MERHYVIQLSVYINIYTWSVNFGYKSSLTFRTNESFKEITIPNMLFLLFNTTNFIENDMKMNSKWPQMNFLRHFFIWTYDKIHLLFCRKMTVWNFWMGFPGFTNKDLSTHFLKKWHENDLKWTFCVIFSFERMTKFVSFFVEKLLSEIFEWVFQDLQIRINLPIFLKMSRNHSFQITWLVGAPSSLWIVGLFCVLSSACQCSISDAKIPKKRLILTHISSKNSFIWIMNVNLLFHYAQDCSIVVLL